MAMISICVPVISAIPDEEQTEEEVHKIVKELMETQYESKGWIQSTIPNRNDNGNGDYDDDIAPELWYRYQWDLSRWFKVEYNLQSTNSGTITRSWVDEFWTDADTGSKWNFMELPYDDEQIDQGANSLVTNDFEAPQKGYLDINIDVDVDDDIDSNSGDYLYSNNYDEEYMYFWWLG